MLGQCPTGIPGGGAAPFARLGQVNVLAGGQVRLGSGQVRLGYGQVRLAGGDAPPPARLLDYEISNFF